MKEHEAWLVKAENDLASARKLVEGDKPIYDTAAYHTQQCGEKALKAYLAYNEKPLEKSHDLEYLVELCSETDATFNEISGDAVNLSPYATIFRYPGDILAPEASDVMDAIQAAEKILLFVKKKIR